MAKEIDFLIQTYYKDFSSKYRQIADYILKNDYSIENLSIQNMAKSCCVSPATVSRFAKILGFNNFQSMKIALLDRKKNITGSSLHHGINDDDSYLTMAKKIFHANSAALDSTSALLSEKILTNAIDYIMNANLLGIFGLGASNIVAQDGYHKFLRTSLQVVAPVDYHMQLMQATRLGKNDCAIIISHSGENTDTLEIARVLKQNQVPIIVITSFGNSHLTKLSNINLLSISEEQNFRVEALHALISQISIIDSLFMMIVVKSGKDTEKIFSNIRHEIDKTRNKKEHLPLSTNN